MKRLLLVLAFCLVFPFQSFAGLIESAKCPAFTEEPQGGYTPGETFYHNYTIHNSGGCDVVITKVKKIWYSKNAAEGKKSAIAKVNYREGHDSTSAMGEEIYEVNYRIAAGKDDDGWTLVFYSDPSVKDDVVYSCFIYYGYYDSPSCTQKNFDDQFMAEKTTAKTSSRISESHESTVFGNAGGEKSGVQSKSDKK